MLGKLVKGLSGLGGASALATGGMFLKNHVDRKNFLWESDTKAKILEGDGSYGLTLFKSNMSQDVIERNWIIEVGGGNWDKATKYTKDEMLEYEKEQWEKINKKPREGETVNGVSSRYIDIEEWRREEIEGKYKDYWEKYYESCLAWNRTRKDNTLGSGSGPTCTVLLSKETYEAKDEYKKYKELKGKGLKIGAGEFYWTIWRKFEKEKDSLSGANIEEKFNAWRAKPENTHLFSEINAA